jgi:hypothetical protein
MLCCAVLCCAVLCCAVLCCAVLCFAVCPHGPSGTWVHPRFQVMRDNTQRLAVTAWRHSEVLTRMGRNPPPATYNIEEVGSGAIEWGGLRAWEAGVAV